MPHQEVTLKETILPKTRNVLAILIQNILNGMNVSETSGPLPAFHSRKALGPIKSSPLAGRLHPSGQNLVRMVVWTRCKATIE